MGAKNNQKQKAKRKAKQKERRQQQSKEQQKDKSLFYAYEAERCIETGNLSKAEAACRKALRLDPDNAQYWQILAYCGQETENTGLELEAATRLYEMDALPEENTYRFITLLVQHARYEEALAASKGTDGWLDTMRVSDKRRVSKELKYLRQHCHEKMEEQRQNNLLRELLQEKYRALQAKVEAETPATATDVALVESTPAAAAQTIVAPVTVRVEVDAASFEAAFSGGMAYSRQHYELALEAHRIRFQDAFENLVCLSQLKGIQSLWYQEETARKVLKRFRGRALLADEVGLGKTIEAAIVLKEYIQRGMVRTALILTPTPLVSQWKEELATKFDLHFVSTDDPDFRPGDAAFWQQSFVLASINQAKSSRHFATVAGREYDIVIVDEAHHLKNRATLNWKLVNALKKRFLLLLTATPVENNLLELYNLVTLLKPGQLSTARAFREEFMTRGDPTSPQNRLRLKELLGQVMIRNTRAVARLNLPPRFAQTIRVEPSAKETALYAGIDKLVRQIDRSDGKTRKMLLKNLLSAAGSSPRAVAMILTRWLERDEAHDASRRREIGALQELARAIEKSGKNRVMLKLLGQARGKTIIFVKYLGTLEQVSQALQAQKIAYAQFHGAMSNAVKDAQIAAFQDDKPVLVTTEIGGEGRNLQFCSEMINYDLPWNPMKIEQRIGRLHRIGQRNEVRIHNLCAAGSVEDCILEILDRKINMFEMVIGEIDMVLGRLKADQEFSDLVYDIWVRSPSEDARTKGFEQLGKQLKRSKTQYESTRILDQKLFGENYEL